MGKFIEKINQFSKKLKDSKKKKEKSKIYSDIIVPFGQMPDNPGKDKELTIKKLTDESVEKEIETVVAAEILYKKLIEKGLKTKISRDGWLYLSDTGYYLLPLIIEANIEDNDMIKTSTTIQVNHKEFLPNGMFEYQDAVIKETAEEALLCGFENWFNTDWETLLWLFNQKK